MSPESPGGTLQVTAALLCEDGRYLITRRPQGVHLAGLWEFPGGKQDEGESLEECLAREVAEETGLRIEVLLKEREILHAYPERTVHLHFFRCRRLEGQARPLGVAEVAWVPASGLGSYVFPEADAPLVQDIVAGRIRP